MDIFDKFYYEAIGKDFNKFLDKIEYWDEDLHTKGLNVLEKIEKNCREGEK